MQDSKWETWVLCAELGAEKASRQLGSSLWFWDYWFPTGNQVLELNEEHKRTLDHQLANLQVSGPVNRLGMPFSIHYLAQGCFCSTGLP